MDNGTKECGEIAGTLVTDSQGLDSVYESVYTECRRWGFDREDITGALVQVGDGDYSEAWITTYRSPHSIHAMYHRMR